MKEVLHLRRSAASSVIQGIIKSGQSQSDVSVTYLRLRAKKKSTYIFSGPSFMWTSLQEATPLIRPEFQRTNSV